MSEVTGVIQAINARTVAGGKTAYDVVIAGQKYGAGFFKPKANEGDYVTFTATQNGNFQNIERGTLKVSANKPAASEAATQKSAVGKAVNSFDARQDAISRQAASNTAIAWVNLLHTAGALNIPASKKGQAQAILDTLRLEYEKKFYEGNTGNEWKDISPNPTAVDEAGDEASPEDGDTPWE
jgi:hypothetical protein